MNRFILNIKLNPFQHEDNESNLSAQLFHVNKYYHHLPFNQVIIYLCSNETYSVK